MPRPKAKSKPVPNLKKIVLNALDDLKARDVKCMDVTDYSDVTDLMIVASGTSKRHVRSLAELVITRVKEKGMLPLGTEGQEESEWVLVDLGDVVVNLMLPDTRSYYELEKLWSNPELRPGDINKT